VSPTCDGQVRTSLGAYAIGALDPSEGAVVDAHLAQCAGCRDELAELADVTGLLALVPPDSADVLEGIAHRTRELRPRPRAATRGSRRTGERRALAAAVGLAVLMAGALGIASLTGDRGSRDAGILTTHSANRVTKVSARAVLHAHRWGTAMALRLRGVRPHERCRLIVVARDRSRETAATWRANYEGEATAEGATGIQLHEIALLQVIADRRGQLIEMQVRD
jgi:Putative zinc-finger